MKDESHSIEASLSVPALERIEGVCLAFEAAWREGERPRIEDHLGATEEPERCGLLRELILLDVDYRSRSGEHPSEEEYAARFPQDRQLVGDVFGEVPEGCGPRFLKALNQYLAAFQAGSPPTIEEMLAQYPELGEELEECLASLEFVRRAEVAPLVIDPQEEFCRKTLGDFRVLREIGRGGMGVVYEAEQVSLGRRVALKMLPFAAMLDPRQLQRFKNEAKAAATLDHPQIVQVHSVGCERGVHYYAMQYVEGPTLAEVIGELRQLAGLDAADDRQAGATQLTLDLYSGRLGRESTELSPLSRGETGHTFRRQGECEAGPVVSGSSPDSASLPDPAEPGSQELDVAAPPTRGGPRSHEEALPVVGPSGSGQARNVFGEVSIGSPLFFRAAAGLGIQLAEALQHAHELGVVHRDVKPSNVLLDARGHPWLADFGLAMTKSNPNLTMTGDVLGTFRYMSPEQAAGKHGVLDHRTDIYSLGATLYELLTLESAVVGSDRRQVLRAIRERAPEAPRRLKKAIPKDLETIVLKAMAKDPRHRYGTAGQLAEDLRLFTEDRPIQTRRISLPERAWRWCRRNPLVAALEAAVAIVLLAVIVVSSLSAVRSNTQERITELSRFDSLMAEGEAARWNRNAGRRFVTLAHLKQAAGLAGELELGDVGTQKVRAAAIPLMALPDLRVTGRPWKRPEGSQGGWFSPNLKRCAIEDERGDLSIRRVRDGFEEFSIPSPGPRRADPVFSPDGRLLAQRYLLGNRVVCYVWELGKKGANEVILKVAAREQGDTVDFSANGRWIAIDAPDQLIHVYDVGSRERLHSISNTTVSRQICFQPKKKRLAILCEECSTVHVLDIETKKSVAEIRHPGAVHQMAWHPDGKLLAGASLDFHIYVWNAELEKRQTVLEGHQGEVMALAFNHAGDMLASRSLDGTTRLWDPVTGSELLRIEGEFQRFSADDRLLAFRLADTMGVWEVADRECRTFHILSRRRKGPYSVDLSPDGRLMATAGENGVRLWDAATGREIVLLPLGNSGSAIFSTDGRTLVTAGVSGLQCWPIEVTWDTGTVWVGPPTVLRRRAETRTPRPPVCSVREDLIAAITGGSEVLVRRRKGPTETILRGGHDNVAFTAVSPDGHWVATGAWGGDGVRVWDAGTGELVGELMAGSPTNHVAFSPDGRWLVASKRGAYQFCEVGSWEPGHRLVVEHAQLVGPLAFSPGGDVLAIAYSRSTAHLIDVATGETLAALQSPDPIELTGISFSPDGRQLLTVSMNRRIHLWDLCGIRQRLAKMGLDWHGPPYSLPVKTPASKSLSAELMLDEWAPMESLAASHYRKQHWDAAFDEHEKSMSQRFGGNGYDWFFMAMIQWQRGERDAAHEWYDRAQEWLASNRPHEVELHRSSRQAALLLGRRRADYALSFDGDDDCVAIPSLRYDGSHPITVEATVTPVSSNPDNQPGIPHMTRHWSSVLADTSGGGIDLQVAPYGFKFATESRDRTGARRWVVASSFRSPFRARQVHLAGVFDNRSVRLYVDGKLAAGKPAREGDFQASPHAIMIAANPYKKGRPSGGFKGIIDEVRISRSARYAGDFEPPSRLEADDDTLALYHFDEGAGAVAGDSSGNGHHGQIHGAQWVMADELPPPLPPPPQEPAWFPWEPRNPPDEVVDLLALLDPERDQLVGDCGFDDTTLVTGGGQEGCTLQIPYAPPEEYDLAVAVRRLWRGGGPALNLGLVVGGARCSLFIDAGPTPPCVTGLRRLKDSPRHERDDVHVGEVLPCEVQRTVYCRVRKADKESFAIEVMCDGDTQPIYQWRGRVEELSIPAADWSPGVLTLRSGRHSHFRISHMQLTPISKNGRHILSTDPSTPKNRLVAERILWKRGAVWVSADGQAETKIERLGDLPDDYVLTGIDLTAVSGLSSADLELSGLRGLRQLRLAGQTPIALDTVLESLGGLERLERLDLVASSTTDQDLQRVVTRLPDLKELDLSNTEITDAGLACLSKLANLEKLELRATQVTTRGLAHVKNYIHLRSLDLANTRVGQEGARQIAELPHLEELDLRLARISDAALAHVRECPRLRRLRLAGTGITDEGLRDLAGLSGLEELDLRGTEISDAGLQDLQNLSSLKRLQLDEAPITDAGLEHLHRLPNLTHLSLMNTQISDAALPHLQEQKGLEELCLIGTCLTRNGFEALRKGLPSCRIVGHSNDSKDLLGLVRAELQSADGHLRSAGGHWKLMGEAIRSDGTRKARLDIPLSPPDEYLLELIVERQSGKDALRIGFVAGGRQASVMIDGWGGTVTALREIDGKPGNKNETSHPTTMLLTPKPVSIRVAVLKSGISVACDGRLLVDWSGDVRRLPAAPGGLYLRSWSDIFRITKVQLTPITREGSFESTHAE